MTISDDTPTRHTDMQMHVVGLIHNIEGEDELRKFLKAATRLDLFMEYEPNNPKDKYAIAVYKTSNPMKPVGHISRDDLMKTRYLMDHQGTDRMRIKVLCQQPGCASPTLLAYPLDDKGGMIATIDIPLTCYLPYEVRFMNDFTSRLYDQQIPVDKSRQLYSGFGYMRDSMGMDLPQDSMTKIARYAEARASQAHRQKINVSAAHIGVASAGDGTLNNY